MADVLTLRPRNWTAWLTFLTCVLFAIGGVWMILGGAGAKGWFAAIVFGVGALIGAVMVLPGNSHLRLTREGFEVKSLYKSNLTPWEAAGAFWPGRIGLRDSVLYDFADGKDMYVRDLGKHIAGAHGAFPDTYGLKAEALAELMNAWCAWALAGAAGSPPNLPGVERPPGKGNARRVGIPAGERRREGER